MPTNSNDVVKEAREHLQKRGSHMEFTTRKTIEALCDEVERLHSGDSSRDDVFPWGTAITIDGETYWLNRCSTCPTSLAPTYHVIKGEPQPSLNEMMNED